MLDGRIDTQGTIKDLRARGVLDGIEQDSAADVKSSEPVVASEEPIEAIDAESPELGQGQDGNKDVSKQVKRKRPRKLVKDEHREQGGVKFSIYKSYMKASYVDFLLTPDDSTLVCGSINSCRLLLLGHIGRGVFWFSWLHVRRLWVSQRNSGFG